MFYGDSFVVCALFVTLCFLIFRLSYLVEVKSENIEILTGSLYIYDHKGGRGRNLSRFPEWKNNSVLSLKGQKGGHPDCG